MAINNEPTIKPKTVTGIFTKYIAKTIPLAFDESMSYYECLCALLEYLNKTVVPDINNVNDGLSELQTFYEELQNYVNTYFDNLDVQEEINNKLDDMAESGQLTDIIAQYLGLAGMITFDTVADMKLAENLVNGSKCATLGYRSVNDGGKAFYKVRTVTNDDVVNEMDIIALYDNLLVAELVNIDVYPETLGAYGDGTHDDSTVINYLINYCNLKHKNIKFNKKIYSIENPILITDKTYINFNYATLKANDSIEACLKLNPSDSSYRIEECNLLNVTLNGNKNATYCLYANDFGKCIFENFTCFYGITHEVHLTQTNKVSNENTLNNFKIYRKDVDSITEDIENTVALYVDIKDSYFNEIISTNYKYHIQNIQGVNWYNKCHGWNADDASSIFTDSYFIKSVQDSKMNNCNSSGTKYVIYLENACRVFFANGESIITDNSCIPVYVNGAITPKIIMTANYFNCTSISPCTFTNFNNIKMVNNYLYNITDPYRLTNTFNNLSNASTNKLSSYLTLPNGYYKLEFMTQSAEANCYSAYSCLITNGDVNYNSFNVITQGSADNAPYLINSSIIRLKGGSDTKNVFMVATRMNPYF